MKDNLLVVINEQKSQRLAWKHTMREIRELLECESCLLILQCKLRDYKHIIITLGSN